jgi:uncharacterized protein (DUF433 family)
MYRMGNYLDYSVWAQLPGSGLSRGNRGEVLRWVARFGQVVPSGQEVAAARQLRDNEVVADAITQDPEVMHGIPVFRGTRVPVQTMFEYLEGGESLEDFLAGFPTVPRSVALEALGEARRLLLARAS